jgi:hypothetical protein
MELYRFSPVITNKSLTKGSQRWNKPARELQTRGWRHSITRHLKQAAVCPLESSGSRYGPLAWACPYESQTSSCTNRGRSLDCLNGRKCSRTLFRAARCSTQRYNWLRSYDDIGARVAQSVAYSIWLQTGRPGDLVSIPGRGKGFFLYPLCPERLWGPPSLLYNGYRGSFSLG